jgi:hypothetical protein
VSRASVKAGDSWEAVVAEYAQLNGWHLAHFRRAQTSKGWRTPVGYEGKGFVDFVMTRERVLFVECKTGSGRRTREQKWWAEWLEAAGAEYHCWRPSDWNEIERTLRRR